MFVPLKLMLAQVIRTGDLVVIDSCGKPTRLGDGTGRRVQVRLTDAHAERELALDPSLAAGEAYMQGRLLVEEGEIYDLLALVMDNMARQPLPAWSRCLDGVRWLTRLVAQYNPVWRARRNASHHYDIDPRVYELFLDPDRQYSCAYFEPGADLDRAQLLKKRHIATKLVLKPGQRVLDIGSGWGGLAAYLSRTCGVNVTGLTLSAEQYRYATENARRLGMSHRVKFKLLDYRLEREVYDRIVSVGMFEHVGRPHYRTFFSRLAAMLAEDGVALLHTIGRSDMPAATNPFIAKYIFPGGYIPALSEVLPAIERAGLMVTDVEVLRLHYAETLRAWRQRFRANWARAAAIAGEEFCRMWEFYLAASEGAFRYQNLVVFQIQLTKRVDALPLTRTYMAEEENRLARMEDEIGESPRLAGE